MAPSSRDLVDTGKRADINVFTVASGHLYEVSVPLASSGHLIAYAGPRRSVWPSS